MGGAIAGLLLFATIGPHTAFFPTIFVACFVIGLGVGIAFMPLMTLAMANVPPEDAGLGSGITNLAHQIGGAVGLAVLGTLAANHTQALLAADHGRAAALVGGYQFAFVIGAAVVGAGTVLAYALLRPRAPRPELRLASVPARDAAAHRTTTFDTEDQAA
jgi:MFS family permease